jgi:hypothetical protein
MGRARQHAVFGGNPAFAFAFKKARDAPVDTGGAKHTGIAEFNQNRAFCMFGKTAGEFDVSELIRVASARSHVYSDKMKTAQYT